MTTMNLSMTIGDYRQWIITVSKSCVVQDLTGIRELTFTLTNPDGSVFAHWTLGAGQVVLLTQSGATLGQAILTVTPAMQATFAEAYTVLMYVWSLVDAVGNPTLILESGSFTFTPPPPGVP